LGEVGKQIPFGDDNQKSNGKGKGNGSGNRKGNGGDGWLTLYLARGSVWAGAIDRSRSPSGMTTRKATATAKATAMATAKAMVAMAG
jgi:hypothetical protein